MPYWPLCSTLNSWFRFLMSRTGYIIDTNVPRKKRSIMFLTRIIVSQQLCRSFTRSLYIQGQSPEAKVREYFYFIDHQGMVGLILAFRICSNYVYHVKARWFNFIWYKNTTILKFLIRNYWILRIGGVASYQKLGIILENKAI